MYGDEHRGVCVEVDMDVNNDKFCIYTEYEDSDWLYGEINYTNEAQRIEDLRNDLKQVLWNKSKQWSHEQEVRFVTKATSENGNTYLPINIKAIYLGRRMDKDKARNIKMLCDAFDVKYVDLSDPNNERLVNYWNDCKNKPYKK